MDSLIVTVLAPEGLVKAHIAESLRDLPVRVIFEPWLPVDWTEFLERLARLDVGAVLVDYDRLQDELPEIASRVKSIRPPSPPVIAVSTRAETSVEHGALEAGADRFLKLPLERTLGRVLEEIAARKLASQAVKGVPGRVLGLAGVHGGCGTSTIACLLALGLHRVTRQPVLLADLDHSGGMIGFLTGARTPYSLLDAMAALHRLEANYWKTLVASLPCGIDVIPAPADPGALRSVDAGRLCSVLRFLRARYSWIVTDLGEVWDGAWSELRGELDQLWLIATPGPAGLYQTRRAAERLRSAGLERSQWRLLINHAGRPAVTADEVESLTGKRPDAWMPESGELREEARSEGLLALRGKSVDRIARLAARLAGVPESNTAAPLNLPALRALRRERFPRLAPRL